MPRRVDWVKQAKHSLGIGAAIVTLGWGGSAQAGLLTVMGDVNAGVEENQQVFDNILGLGQSILFSRERAQIGRLIDHFGAQPGLTTTTTNAPVTAGLLAGVDLLVLTAFYNAPFTYSLAEQHAIRDFIQNSTGNVLMVAEASDAGVLAGYNAFLAEIGAGIQYTGLRHNDFGTVSSFPDLNITENVIAYELNRYNSLNGGTEVVTTGFGTAVAQQGLGPVAAVPVPPPLLGLGGALMLLWPLRFWRRKAPPTSGKR